MDFTLGQLLLFLSIPVALATQIAAGEKKTIVIAHRGASGYLPEHTLEAVSLAHGMGADYIEQDVVLTKDEVPVVLHDIHLDTVTDVAKRFPNRARDDGRWYAIDFELNEIKTLRVTERIDLKSKKPVYPKRFPTNRSHFQVPTLAEEIELIQGLNKSTGRDVGIYVEIKSPAWHRESDKDISQITLAVLGNYGYKTIADRAFVETFDAAETRRIREELKSKLRLVQLIGDNEWNEAPTDYDQLRTPKGMKAIAEYADGIGPRMEDIVTGRDTNGRPIITNLVKWAHDENLIVHPYTFRADDFPKYAKSFDELLDIFLKDAKVDGLFTDFPDQAVRRLNH